MYVGESEVNSFSPRCTSFWPLNRNVCENYLTKPENWPPHWFSSMNLILSAWCVSQLECLCWSDESVGWCTAWNTNKPCHQSSRYGIGFAEGVHVLDSSTLQLITVFQGSQVFVLAASNRLELIEPTILRSGRWVSSRFFTQKPTETFRLDRVLHVPLQNDVRSKVAIFKVCCQNHWVKGRLNLATQALTKNFIFSSNFEIGQVILDRNNWWNSDWKLSQVGVS